MIYNSYKKQLKINDPRLGVLHEPHLLQVEVPVDSKLVISDIDRDEKPTRRFWVDPVAGSNSNDGSQESPFATLTYATAAARVPDISSDDYIVVNLVPSGNLQADDNCRFVGANQGARYLIRGAGGVYEGSTDTNFGFIEAAFNAQVTARFENLKITCTKVIFFSGTETAGRDSHFEIAGSCEFIHSRLTAEEAMRLRGSVQPVNGSIKIESGAKITGWPAWALLVPGSIDLLQMDGAIFESDSSLVGQSEISGDIDIQNCTFNFPNGAVNNRLRIEPASSTSIVLRNNNFTVNTDTQYPIWIRRVPTSGPDVDVEMTGNTISGSFSSYMLHIGDEVGSASTRATQEAASKPYASVLVENNSIVNNATNGGVLRIGVNADNAIVRGNYFRVAGINETSDVHQVYLFGRNTDFSNNNCQAQILAFGPGQKIEKNVIVARRGVLLGGTGGGSQLVGGGNDYTIRNNLIIATSEDCYSDYSFNNAYPTNLGDLIADIDRNQYIVMLTAAKIATLTESSLAPTTIEQLRNVWQNSALTGSGSVYGDAGNATNDGASKLIDGGAASLAESIVVADVELTSADFSRLRKRYLGKSVSGVILLIPGLP